MPKVIIDFPKCNGCLECVDVCPMDVFEKSTTKVKIARESDCIACGACKEDCKMNCITIQDDL